MKKLFLVFTLLPFVLFGQLSNTNVWMMRGDSKTLSFNYNGNVLNDTLIFVVKSSKNISAVRLINKTTYDNQISILFGVSSFIYVRLDAGDTDDLTLAKYYYDITRIHNGDTTTILIGELNLQPDIGTPFDGTDITGRVTTVSLANGSINRELVWWNDSLEFWEPSGITFSAGGSVGNADSLGGVPASEYLIDDDSANQRTFSDLKYPSKDSIQTWAETQILIAQQINDSLTTYYADIQALFDSITAIRAVVGYPAVPSPYDVLSPDVFYLAYGYDNYIFYDNLGIGVPDPPSVFFTPDSGDAYSNYYNFVPAASGEFSFTMGISSDTMQTLMRSLDSDIMITRGKLLAIGDSRTAGGQWVTQLKTLVGDSLDLIGTLGTPPYYHEGISGWAYNTFCTNVSSPFVNNGHVDFDNYMTTNGFDTLNFVIIRLGTNDVFSANNSTITNTTTTALNYADSLIDAIHNYNTNTLIGICMETPPANDSTFLATYGGTQSYSQYKYNIHYFNKQLKAKYGADGSRELSYVSLIPLYLVADKDNDFANGVHENTIGYNKEAVAMLGWLWNQRLIYMDNIVVNGEFTTNIDNWSANETPATMEWLDGQMHIIADGVNDGTYQQIPIEAGKTYNLSFDINLISGTAIRTGIFLVSHQGYGDYNVLGTHTYSAEFTATQTGTAYLWSYATTGASEWYLDNVSVREKY